MACAVVAAAGCGGGGDSGTTTAASQPAVASSAPEKGPDGLEKVAARCQTSKERSASPEVVPAEFRPTHTRVVAAKRTSGGLQRNGTPSEVRLSAVSACPQYATATVETG